MSPLRFQTGEIKEVATTLYGSRDPLVGVRVYTEMTRKTRLLSSCIGFRVEGAGFGVEDLEFRV